MMRSLPCRGRPFAACFTTTILLAPNALPRRVAAWSSGAIATNGGYRCSPPTSRGTTRRFATASPNIIVKAPKLKVVLDMDECMVHSRFLDDERHRGIASAPETYRQNEFRPDDVNHRGIDSFRLELDPVEEGMPKEQVMVNKRPKLDEFLLRLSDEYDTYVFTAGVESYANAVLDQLDPTGAFFKARYYRNHCKFVQGVFLKDLTIITPDLSRVVLVDNNPVSFVAQPSNGIPVPSFYDDPKDNSLEHVMELIERYLYNVEDVRPSLDKFFQLRHRLAHMRQSLLGEVPLDKKQQQQQSPFDADDDENIPDAAAAMSSSRSQ